MMGGGGTVVGHHTEEARNVAFYNVVFIDLFGF